MLGRTDSTRKTAIGMLTAGLLAGALGGCAGHGSYTTEHISAAKHKLNVMKAATEWEMGRQAFLSGNFDKATRKVENSLELNDQVTKSHVLMGRIRIETGDMGGALESLTTALDIDPEFVEAHYYMGVVHERLDKLETSLTHYSKASELDGFNPQYAVAAAEMMIDLGLIDEAKDYLSSGPSFEHHAGVRQALGHIALIQDESSVAAEHFAEARLLSPDNDAIAEDLVRAQMRTGKWREAERLLTQLLDEPEHAKRRDLLHRHATCLIAIDRPVDARGIYQNLSGGTEGRSDLDAWIGLARASHILGDDRTLRRAASRAVALGPDRFEGYALTAMWFQNQGQHDAALKSVGDAQRVSPNNPQLIAFEGKLLDEAERPQEARQRFALAVKLSPENQAYRRLLLDSQARAAERNQVFTSVPTTTE